MRSWIFGRNQWLAQEWFCGLSSVVSESLPHESPSTLPKRFSGIVLPNKLSCLLTCISILYVFIAALAISGFWIYASSRKRDTERDAHKGELVSESPGDIIQATNGDSIPDLDLNDDLKNDMAWMSDAIIVLDNNNQFFKKYIA